MRIALVGARGSGKTTLLDQIAQLYPNIKTIDLDRYIEAEKGQPIANIFTCFGEPEFRRIEEECLKELSKKISEQVIVAVGAGYVGDIPDGFTCVWIQRSTDLDGRIFLDRPRLDPDLNELEEYLHRYSKRRQVYKKQSNFQYELPEGEHPMQAEAFLSCFLNPPEKPYGDFDFTVYSEMAEQEEFLKRLIDLCQVC
ncbi:MAG: shikimate kinase [Bdellovibrionales bacterium]